MPLADVLYIFVCLCLAFKTLSILFKRALTAHVLHYITTVTHHQSERFADVCLHGALMFRSQINGCTRLGLQLMIDFCYGFRVATIKSTDSLVKKVILIID